MQGLQDLLHRAAGQVGAADGAGEESVAGKQELFGREIEADAALGVTGGVEDREMCIRDSRITVRA